MEPYLSLSLIAGFSVVSFLFAAAESAFFSLSQWQTRRLAKEQPGRGELVSRLLANPQELISSLALGSTFANCIIIGLSLLVIIDQSTWQFVDLALSARIFLITPLYQNPKGPLDEQSSPSRDVWQIIEEIQVFHLHLTSAFGLFISNWTFWSPWSVRCSYSQPRIDRGEAYPATIS